MSAPSTDIRTALTLMQQGRHAQAEQVCRQILAADPDDFGASHLLGVALLIRGEATAAEQQIAHAIAINPDVAGAYYNRGNALLALGRADEAIASYDQALARKADMVDALCNRGKAQVAQGRYDDAIASYQQALAIQPGRVDAHDAMGEAFLKTARKEQALACFDRAIALSPAHASALNNRGSALYALGRLDDALASYDRAIAAVPNAAEPHDNRGLVLQDLGRFHEALASHDTAIARNPDLAGPYLKRALVHRQFGDFDKALHDAERAVALQSHSAQSHDCRGIVLNDMGRYQDALVDYRKALDIDPGFAQAHNNIGNVLYDMGRMDEALAHLDQAIALRSGFPEAHSNRGLVLQDTLRFDAARQAYDQAIALRPIYPEAYKRRATLHLLQGDLGNGMADFDISLQQARMRAPGPLADIPQWTGEPLQGKSILLTESGGLGDILHFWRFIPALVAMDARVSFLGPERLFRLLRSSGYPARLLPTRPEGEHFDYHDGLWSLLHRLGTTLDTIPCDIPYLAAEPALVKQWSSLLDPDRFNIGISWQGKPSRKIDAGRSIPLQAFRHLAQVPGVRLVSLQKNAGVEQLQELPEGMSVVDPGEAFDTGADAFVDTAALMTGLDLVVSSDTSIVHLAGALGRPTWVGLKHVPEWRWMLEREDSPWYPSARLFRQAEPGDWEGVFAEMAGVLRGLT